VSARSASRKPTWLLALGVMTAVATVLAVLFGPVFRHPGSYLLILAWLAALFFGGGHPFGPWSGGFPADVHQLSSGRDQGFGVHDGGIQPEEVGPGRRPIHPAEVATHYALAVGLLHDFPQAAGRVRLPHDERRVECRPLRPCQGGQRN